MQFYLFDYLILIIIILSIIIGFKRGFINTITSMVNTLLAVIIGLVKYEDCAVYLNKHFNLASHIRKIIQEKFPPTTLSIETPLYSKGILVEFIKFQDATETLTNLIVTIISFFVIFFLVLLLLNLLSRLLQGIFSWVGLSWINRLLGMVIVPFKNIFILIVIIGLTFPAIELAAQIGLNGAILIHDLIEESLLASLLLDSFVYIKALLIT